MKIRAVIFDVYGTLLQVGPPPADADARWQALLEKTFGTAPGMSRLEFSVASSRAIGRRHAAAQARGVQCPEILWPAIVAEIFPEFRKLTPQQQEDFVFEQIQIGRTIHLFRGAADVLRLLVSRGCEIGIASNAQAYTLRELREVLAAAMFDFAKFNPSLCFWSFQHGFSKPNPHAFQIMDIRLDMLGITADRTLMVGDRLDNDIAPARAQGWQTWHLGPAGTSGGGDWSELRVWLEKNVANA